MVSHRAVQVLEAVLRAYCPQLPCPMSSGAEILRAPPSIVRSGKYPASAAVGVGHNEESLPDVRTACLLRREDARRDLEAHSLQLVDDGLKAEGEVPDDVLEEDPSWSDLADDPRDFRPEVPRILLSPAMAGRAEGLAGIAGSDEMNAAAPRAAVEGSQVVPDRSRIQGLVRHPGHESGRCMGFPLDEAHGAISGLGDVQAEVEPGVAGAERQSSKVAGLRFEVGT